MSDFSSAKEILFPTIGNMYKGIREKCLHMDKEGFSNFNHVNVKDVENFENGNWEKGDIASNVKMYEQFIFPSNRHIVRRCLFRDMPNID